MTEIKSQPKNEITRPVGAVMVVGGGIAGMQAALDLADQGFKVYLVEEKSAIGGHMAQLDKTFPTNDCAMCNISPKLVDVGRHLNIEILTNSDVLKVEGEAGNFDVLLRCRPRYIDPLKCVGCGDCAEVCPVSIIDHYEEGLKKRKAAYRLYSQAVPAAYAIEKLGTAPCRDACPADQRAQGYIALIANGRYKEAFRVIKEDNPFPSVCGRTCHHPCEGHCSRALIDEPVSIMALKRFVIDYALAYGREKVMPVPRTRPEWVAIVGSGPAGLTAAHDLVKMGYGVTVYEALPVAGGMMRVGIPAHRLPKGVLQQDIDDILALGVNIKTNSPIENPTDLLDQGYSAVCLATGISSRDQSLGLDGEKAKGVISAATFLRKINLGESVEIGNRVAVIGGGITALDAAAVARRLGSEVVYLVLDRPRGELPAYHWEVASVEAEGIQLFEKTTSIKIHAKENRVTAIELAEIGKGVITDEHGLKRPKTIPGTEFLLQVDNVIVTFAQYSDLSYLDPEYENLEVNSLSFMSQHQGLFVVGGRKTGASFIIEAVRLGHQVAQSIHHYLQDLPIGSALEKRSPVVKFTRQELTDRVDAGEISLQARIQPQLIPMEERVTSFREVVIGLTEHQARYEASRCLQCGICSECLACEYVCGVDAIDHNMIESEKHLQVGTLILAPGFQAFNASVSGEFGFGRYQNVVNSLQFERLLSASGPTNGHVKRPSDQATPARIAFLQCIGSRDQDHDYCSSVCCMYASKEAVIAKQHHPEIDVHIFMMDMRAFSKGYLEYFKRAENDYGVKYHHCRISSLKEHPRTHDLVLAYVNESGLPISENFNLVVLSVGMEVSDSVRDLGLRSGIELDHYGFCRTDQFDPVETSRPGIYAIGPFREPKDIPESIIEAGGAATSTAIRLSPSRFTQTTVPEYPVQRDVQGEPARTGVFVCNCGSNIAAYVDAPEVVAYASKLTSVVHSENLLYACSQDSIDTIIKRIQELQLNRVVVASCSPLTHGSLFQSVIRSAGLNPYLFEMANIRNQCSWVHSDNKSLATLKAMDLVRMAVARARLLEPQINLDVAVNQSALVLGGGVAGMTVALDIADQGYEVHLVEKCKELGGNLRKVYIPPPEFDQRKKVHPQAYLQTLVDRTMHHPKVKLYLDSQVTGSTGFVGNFSSQVTGSGGDEAQINHGVTVIATGGKEYRGPDFGFGSHERIITQQQFEEMLSDQDPRVEGDRNIDLKGIKSVVMIQCVGPAKNFCSRICCTVALKNAIALNKINQNVSISILHRDIRSYGFKERYYEEARRSGVIFIRYDDEHHPEVILDGDHVFIKAWDQVLSREILINPDYVVLSMPVIPHEDSFKLGSLFKVPVDQNGFFQEVHVKLRPVDFSTSGIFMAGMAHYPKLLDESIIQAKAAAAKAVKILSSKSLVAGGQVAVVDQAKCTGCLTCVRICPFAIPRISPDHPGVGGLPGVAYIESTVCQGCGACAAACPARAIQVMHYTDAQMMTKIKSLTHPDRYEIAIDQEQVV